MSVSHDEYIGQILEAIDADQQVSQRSLARSLGIALGLTNLLVKRLVIRGLVRVSKVQPHRVSYLLTPAGLAEKTRMSQRALEHAITRYRGARTRIETTFAAVTESFPADATDKPVVFYGTGEVAEIGYICLQEFDLRLAGAIDDCGKSRFLGVTVYPDVLAARRGVPEDTRYVVATVTQMDVVREQLRKGRIAAERVFWV